MHFAPALPRSCCVLLTGPADTPPLIRALEKHDFIPLRGGPMERALAVIGRIPPDAVVLGASAGGAGRRDFRAFQEAAGLPDHVPVLAYVPSAISRAQRHLLLADGAWDVLSRPLDAEELYLRLRIYVRAKLDADRRLESALADRETGVYNWVGFMSRAVELVSLASRYERPVTAVAAALGPTAGAADGDARARHVGGVLRRAVRTSDVVGVASGVQVVMLAPDTDDAGARVLADRLTDLVRSESPGARVGYAVPGTSAANGTDAARLVFRAVEAASSV